MRRNFQSQKSFNICSFSSRLSEIELKDEAGGGGLEVGVSRRDNVID